MAGYSGTPLATKLGIKEGFAVAALHAPSGFADLLDPIPQGVKLGSRLSASTDLVVAFFSERSALEGEIPQLRKAVFPDRTLWLAWPKKASKLPTTITEDVIREVVLPIGLVDVKVCAIDATWSGLKCVIRKELRKADA
jgi:hypothetical protein